MYVFHGNQRGPEFDAAQDIKNKLEEGLNQLVEAPNPNVRADIYVSPKAVGQKNEDFDIVIAARIEDPCIYTSKKRVLNRDREQKTVNQTHLHSFVIVLETKNHPPEKVDFSGGKPLVRYVQSGKEFWKDALEQAFKQVFSLRDHIRNRFDFSPWVAYFVYFPALRETDLPDESNHYVAADTEGLTFVDRLISTTSLDVNAEKADAHMRAANNKKMDDLLREKIFPSYTPTPLDRKRMDAISKRNAPRYWVDDIGNKLLLVRGRGGSGKTVVLLHLAWRLFDENDRRSLFLTYNRALVADLRRLMALMNVPTSFSKGGICVETIYTFLGRVFARLGILKENEDFLAQFEENKKDLLSYLREGAIDEDDIREVVHGHPDELAFERVFVDEGQDWPDEEVEILRRFFHNENLVVADGVDQLTRRDTHTDWTRNLNQHDVKVRRLRRCLRMKHNLSSFANMVSERLDLDDWHVEPNRELSGGKVVLLRGEVGNYTEILHDLLNESIQKGNKPVDLLSCVPSTQFGKTREEPSNSYCQWLDRSGLRIWDGTSWDMRRHQPTDVDEMRVVHYESCRGLEGWIVFCWGFDEFFEQKYAQLLNAGSQLNTDMLISKEEAALNQIVRWSMIPLTRPMDTLVIHLSGKDNKLSRAIEDLAAGHPDFIESHGRY